MRAVLPRRSAYEAWMLNGHCAEPPSCDPCLREDILDGEDDVQEALPTDAPPGSTSAEASVASQGAFETGATRISPPPGLGLTDLAEPHEGCDVFSESRG